MTQRVAVWMFVKPRPRSITPSDKVAHIIAKMIDAPIVWNPEWAGSWEAKKTEILFIINGAFAFAPFRDAVAPAIRCARRVIFIQNDYAVVLPKSTSIGETPFRAAFRKRGEKGLPEVEFWTTVIENVQRKRDRYVNWNALAYTPLKGPPSHEPNGKVLYYGYFRDYRKSSFDTYFAKGGDWIDVHSPSKDFPKFYPTLNIIKPLVRDARPSWKTWLKQMRGYSAGLYLEDSKSTASYHSPATRFFEMLSARLPIAFDEKCVGTFVNWNKRSGYGIDVEPFVVSNRKELKTFIKHRREMLKKQTEWRHHDYSGDVIVRARKLLSKLLKREI